MDKFLFSTALLIFLLSVAWILDDFEVISLHFQSHQSSQQQEVGKVSKKIKNVQRRGKDSLTWDDVSQDDKLFDYDSVITLPKSVALLKMNSSVDLNMDENTLITILPPEDPLDALTLNLKAGSYKVALSKGKQVRVSGVVLKATEDSSLDFKAGDDAKTYVTIVAGNVSVTNGGTMGGTHGAQVGNAKAGAAITIDNQSSAAKLTEPVAALPPPPPPPPPAPAPPSPVHLKKIVRRKVAVVKTRPKKQKPKTLTQVAPSNSSERGEAIKKRPDEEAMSQDLSELPESK